MSPPGGRPPPSLDSFDRSDTFDDDDMFGDPAELTPLPMFLEP